MSRIGRYLDGRNVLSWHPMDPLRCVIFTVILLSANLALVISGCSCQLVEVFGHWMCWIAMHDVRLSWPITVSAKGIHDWFDGHARNALLHIGSIVVLFL
ncbi:hypothetical protein JTE90_000887 [Oedothorax gibbosus]|uniref:DUF2585 family protein n=1 Tax=Oedothorax gibbosus TaxID=931172 RepID=A0AAV6VVL9_9ARAC|nr:hypothetical protein JTE90_000887 [Oedothorax gibbosus]